MSKYKVVKTPNCSSIYDVYKKRFGTYWKVGYVSACTMEDAQRAALLLVAPPTTYFEA